MSLLDAKRLRAALWLLMVEINSIIKNVAKTQKRADLLPSEFVGPRFQPEQSAPVKEAIQVKTDREKEQAFILGSA